MQQLTRNQHGATPVEWAWSLPSGFGVEVRAVPALRYPWEIAAIANWALPQTDPQIEEKQELPADLPRIDLMPGDGILVWLVMGDAQRDNAALAGGASSSERLRLSPSGVGPASPAESSVPDLDEADEVPSRWPNASMWNRMMALTDPGGQFVAEPLYVQLFAFAGKGGTDQDALQAFVRSLHYRYVGS